VSRRTSRSSASEPEPGPARRDLGPDGWIELVKWLLSDHRRAGWAFSTLVVVLAATVVTAGIVAPHVGDLGGLLSGGVVGGGLGLGSGALAERHRRRRRDRASSGPREAEGDPCWEE